MTTETTSLQGKRRDPLRFLRLPFRLVCNMLWMKCPSVRLPGQPSHGDFDKFAGALQILLRLCLSVLLEGTHKVLAPMTDRVEIGRSAHSAEKPGFLVLAGTHRCAESAQCFLHHQLQRIGPVEEVKDLRLQSAHSRQRCGQGCFEWLVKNYQVLRSIRGSILLPERLLQGTQRVVDAVNPFAFTSSNVGGQRLFQ